jgi:membrane protein implicated in regulation of membrane protease activity
MIYFFHRTYCQTWQNSPVANTGGIAVEIYWVWWLAAAVLVIAEMLSNTFYLIAVALGLASAGCAAYLGAPWGGQAAVAALLCTISVAGVYRWKHQQVKSNEQSNFAYDIGESVQVIHWSDERHARVSYRGAEWDAELAGNAMSEAERKSWYIKNIVGSRLIIE